MALVCRMRAEGTRSALYGRAARRTRRSFAGCIKDDIATLDWVALEEVVPAYIEHLIEPGCQRALYPQSTADAALSGTNFAQSAGPEGSSMALTHRLATRADVPAIRQVMDA